MTTATDPGVAFGLPPATNTVDPSTTIPDLRAVLESAITNHPRTLQTKIGPSELGVGCDRCLVHHLAGNKPRELVPPWLPTIGTAVHGWAEDAVVRHLTTTGTDRYLPEGRVTVGQIGGVPIDGSADLYDTHTGTVVDYKVVGTTTLRSARSKGPSLTYQRQLHLYGAGYAAAGYPVRSVAIWFLPRNGVSLQAGVVWQVPYDPAVAAHALARANQFHAWITGLGVDAVLAITPPHTGDEFGCAKHDDYDQPRDTQLDGLIQTPGT